MRPEGTVDRTGVISSADEASLQVEDRGAAGPDGQQRYCGCAAECGPGGAVDDAGHPQSVGALETANRTIGARSEDTVDRSWIVSFAAKLGLQLEDHGAPVTSCETNRFIGVRSRGDDERRHCGQHHDDGSAEPRGEVRVHREAP